MYKQSIQNISKMTSLLLLGLLTLLIVTKPVYADDTTENIVGFSYKLNYSDHQINGENGYFDLELAPGIEETVIINLSNSGKEKIDINLSVNGTKTNSNGILEYGSTDIENDGSLKFPFEKLVTAPETIELKAGESKEVPIKVTMPETSFDGIILGGIQMKKADVEEEKPSQGATVRNTYSYIVAMRLQNKTTEVKPEIQFNKATGSQRNYRNSVAINLSNTTGSLVKSKLDIESQISKKGSNEVLYERKQTGMSIAPNSQMDFYVSMAGEQMVAGEYTARILASIDDQTWEESLDFTITKEEAEKYNKRDVGLVQDRGLDWKLVAIIVVGFISLIILIFVMVRLIKNKKKKQSRRSTSKSKTKKRNK